MPVTKSAAKQARQNLKRYKRNLQVKRRMKGEIKALIAAIAAGEKAKIAPALQAAQSAIDKAVKNRLIHQNKAAHQKSQLAKMADGKTAPPTPTKSVAKKVVTKKLTPKAVTKKTPASLSAGPPSGRTGRQGKPTTKQPTKKS